MSSQYNLEPPTTGKVLLKTSAGEIEVELWTKECPMTCRNFIQLCYEGYYDGTVFHRLVKDFIIQGGDPTGTGQGGESIYESKTFKDEFHQRLRFNRRGLLGMANSGKDSNGSQFFITIGNEGLRCLNQKHTMFGKVEGPTVFNMLRMTEYDVDENERPKTLHKIISTKVLLNPFDDIIPREKRKEKKEKKKEVKPVEKKKLNLLSFGDEAEEDEMEIEQANKKLHAKGKSAHDVLDDEKLSTQVAVTADEMEDYVPEEETEEDAARSLSSIKAKLAKKRKAEHVEEEEKDVDFERMIDEERRHQEKQDLEKMAQELKSMQREYVKLLRPKAPKPAAPAPEATGAMADYNSMKMKFKSKNTGIVKQRDPARQSQTMDMLNKFVSKLSHSNQEAILFDKKVKIPEVKKEMEEEEEEEKTFGVDLDAEDIEGTDWMRHKFVAEDVDESVSKAKDANLREESEDWYALNDPRNKMVKRRRGEE